MGTSQSSHAKSSTKKAAFEQEVTLSVGGRKTSNITANKPPILKSSVVSVGTHNDEDMEATHGELTYHSDQEDDHEAFEEQYIESDEKEVEYESEEEDDEWEERLRILEEAKALKQVAEFFLHPERPVKSAESVSRCFFDRPSAIPQEDIDDSEEREAILADARALKSSAVNYLHPEIGVTSSVACARNYFHRRGAEQEDLDQASQRDQVLADAAALKQSALHFYHPELPVVSNATACGRNYFTRVSAEEYESPEDVEAREQVLEDLVKLKQAAVDYLHPERPVVSDAFVSGRNYYSRYSAGEWESPEHSEERDQILSDAWSLKQSVKDFLHPELPVTTSDPSLFGRNYFLRPSAVQESMEAAEERAQILADAVALKKYAIDYMHPEIPVSTTDPTLFGRNYFLRASAPPQESIEESEEHIRILADAAALKKYARDYLHPENPVETFDPTAFGRCYFSRPSGTPYETEEEADVRAQVLADAKAFKKLAVDFMHPELGVASDPAACGRSFFSRYSAPEYDSLEDTEARAQVMEDMKEFKHLAADFLHPECPVRSHIAVARNYFSRFSARAEESPEESEERFHILADAAALKKAARHFYHPEFPVSTSDPCATGRNYFDRPNSSAHDRMIHTFASHFDEDEADHHSDHHSEHLDHFGLDEDLELFYMRETLAPRINKNRDEIALDKDEVGSNLSRSPSSVMLVGLDS